MRRRCDSCGSEYEAKRKTSKFCSTRCRVRAHERQETVAEFPLQPPEALGEGSGPVETVTRRILGEAERVDTVLGQQAITLAGRLDRPGSDTGSSVAALSKEFRAVMDAAMAGVGVAADPLDELRARRDRKRAG